MNRGTPAGSDLTKNLVPPPPATASTFPVLDSLRAVGALAVLTTHVAFWSGDYTENGVVGTMLARLDVGVAIFFVLSGFLLSRPYLARAAEGRTPPTTARYLWKRALRILPVYWIAVAIALTFIHGNRDMGLGERVETVVMVNTFTRDANPAGLSHMWSLAVEASFYLLLPILMLAVTGRAPLLRAGRVLVLVAVLTTVTVWWHLEGAAWAGERTQGSPEQWLPAYTSWFAIGIGLALVQVLHAAGRLSPAGHALVTLARQPGVCWALVGGLLLVAATPIAGPSMLAAPTSGQSLTKNLLYAAIGGLLVLTGVFNTSGSRYTRVFTHGVSRRLGWISYGIFALHLAVLHFVMWSTGWELFRGRFLSIWLLTVLLAVLLAEVIYRLVERPALGLKNMRLEGWRPRRGESDTGVPTADRTAAARGTSIR